MVNSPLTLFDLAGFNRVASPLMHFFHCLPRITLFWFSCYLTGHSLTSLLGLLPDFLTWKCLRAQSLIPFSWLVTLSSLTGDLIQSCGFRYYLYDTKTRNCISSPDLSLELQPSILLYPNCLFNLSTWMFKRQLKLYQLPRSPNLIYQKIMGALLSKYI